MSIRTVALLLLPLLLTSCSYAYDVLAVVRGGKIVLMVDPKSHKQPTCLHFVEVRSDVEMLWRESAGDNGNCANNFPIAYGVEFKGKPAHVLAKPLRRGVVYTVNAVSPASGYGEGKFIILPNGRIRNLLSDH